MVVKMEHKKSLVIEEDVTGRLDRVISEMFYLLDHPRDSITDQTIKHHAEDMVLAGQQLLKRLKETGRIGRHIEQGIDINQFAD
jgi:hypothetical protein